MKTGHKVWLSVLLALAIYAIAGPAAAFGFEDNSNNNSNRNYNTNSNRNYNTMGQAQGQLQGQAQGQAQQNSINVSVPSTRAGATTLTGGSNSSVSSVTYPANQSMNYSGGYRVKTSGTTRVEMAPDMALSTPPSTAPCIVSYGGSASSFWGGIGFNGFKQDMDCTAQSYYRTTYGRNGKLQGMTEELMTLRLSKHLQAEREDRPARSVRTTAGRPDVGAVTYAEAVSTCRGKPDSQYAGCMRTAASLR